MDLQDQIPPGVGTTEKTVELKGFAEPEDVLSIIPV